MYQSDDKILEEYNFYCYLFVREILPLIKISKYISLERLETFKDKLFTLEIWYEKTYETKLPESLTYYKDVKFFPLNNFDIEIE